MAVKDYGRPFYERGMRITRFCRVCYNTRDYQEPSGMFGKPDGTGVAQLSKEELYETKRGFGHEEWLNNKEAKISAIPGFSQGFIQRTNVKKQIKICTTLPYGPELLEMRKIFPARPIH